MLKLIPTAVLFDFDGVIVDSKKTHSIAWSKAFKILFSTDIAPFPEKLEGKSPIKIAEYFSEQGGDSSKTQQLYDLKDKILKESNLLAKIYPGVKELLSFLKSKNVPYGIASNATRGFLKKNIEGLGIDVKQFTGYEDYINPKPAPEAYEKLAEKLGVLPEEFSNTWVFEDSFTGLDAAIKANMLAIGVETQHNSEKLQAAGASWTVKNLEDALDHLMLI